MKAWLFPQVLDIARQWLDSYVKCKDGTFPQMLLLIENAHDAADKIFHSIADGITGEQVLKPILRPYDPYGSTALADFDTIRPTYRTKADKSHLSHVVTDSGWEAHVANALEAMNEVICYAKNQGIGFTIPYTINGEERSYLPDFLVRLNDGHGLEDPLNMIIEVSGERRRDKAAKVATMRTLWIPAVNNHGSFGRWAFLEITDPNTVIGAIRIALSDDGLLHMETT